MSDFLPEGWKKEKFEKLFDIAIGGTPSRSEPKYWDSECKTGNYWLSIRDLKGGVVFDTKEQITELGINKSNVKLVPKGTVVMSFKLSVGRAAFTGRDLYTNEAIAAFLPVNEEAIDLKYFYQGLHSWDLIGDIDQAIKGVTLNKEKLRNIQAILPPLPEQQKIAAILTSVDEVIEKTQAQCDKLKDLKTAMMQTLLLPTENKGVGINGKPHTEFKDSPVGRIPKGWEVVRLGALAITKGLQTGPFGGQLHSHEYVETGVPVVMPKDMKGNRITVNSIAKVTRDKANGLEKHKITCGDILFSRRGDIGRFVLVEEQNEGWLCGTGCLRARLSPSLLPSFLAAYLTLDFAVEWLNNNAVGQTMLNLNTSILSDLPVLLPSVQEQKYIAETIAALDHSLAIKKKKLLALENTKKALMQDLLTGKVRVTVPTSSSAKAC